MERLYAWIVALVLSAVLGFGGGAGTGPSTEDVVCEPGWNGYLDCHEDGAGNSWQYYCDPWWVCK